MLATRNHGDRHAVIGEVRRGSPSQTTVDRHRQLVLHPLTNIHDDDGDDGDTADSSLIQQEWKQMSWEFCRGWNRYQFICEPCIGLKILYTECVSIVMSQRDRVSNGRQNVD